MDMLLLQVAALILSLTVLVAAVLWLRLVRRTLTVQEEALAESRAAHVQTAAALEAAREAIEVAKGAMEQQVRWSTFPHLYCDFVRKNGRSTLVVSNPGSVPAVRVSAFCVAHYDGAATPLEDFLQTYVHKEEADAWLDARGGDPDPREALFGVAYSLSYAFFPAARKLDYPLNLPTPPQVIFVLLQYESVLGENYLRLYRFDTEFAESEPARVQHRLTYRLPEAAHQTERIWPVEHGGRFLLLGDEALRNPDDHAAFSLDAAPGDEASAQEQDGALPSVVRDALLIATLRRSIPARYLKREFAAAWDREVWKDVTERP